MACGLKSGDVVLKLEDVTCPLCRLAMDSGEVNALAAIQTLEECQSLLDHAVVVLQGFAGRGDMVDFVEAVNSRIQVLYDRMGQLRGLAGSR
jgi:hypothetical protein